MKKILLLLLSSYFSIACAADEPLIFAINEGITYRVTTQETRDKYAELDELLSKAIKKPMVMEPVGDYKKLRANLEDKKYFLAFVHPAHHALRAIRDQQYQLVALTKGFTDYKARFIIPKGSLLKVPDDIRGKSMIMPDLDSITAVITRATIRDLGIDIKTLPIRATRYQDAVPFMLENGLNDVGTVGSAKVARDWVQKGGSILFESKPVAIKLIIASPEMSKEDVEKIRAALVGLDGNDVGKKILEKIGFKGFLPGDQDEAMKTLKWLGV